MDIKILSIITTIIGIIIVSINFTFFSGNSQAFALINLFAALETAGIPLFVRYMEYKRIKKIEALFPRFLEDVTENIKSGMTLPQSIRMASNNDYSVLSPYVKEMSAKIEWGIGFETVLNTFAEKTGSRIMKRTVQTIIEAHSSGGTIDTVLEAVASSVQELERIKKERSAAVYSQMVNGYVIYFIFLGVMFGLSRFLIPAFQWEGTQSFAGIYEELFRNLVIIQGIFAGLSIGKMSEGTFIAGFKHSVVLTVMGYTAFLLFG
jgi:flagellar protein FlaJ